MKALLGLLRKEVYHILRDRRTLVVIVALPVLQVIIFGYAIRTDVDHVRLARGRGKWTTTPRRAGASAGR